MWFVIIYICHKMSPIRDPQCSISSLIRFMNSDAVHGPERCTINSTPPGVSRVLGTDSTRATASDWEAMDNMNIMCHWVINQINPRVDDLHGINVIYWARQRRSWVEHSLKIINYSPYSLEVTQEQSALPSQKGGSVDQQHHHAVGIIHVLMSFQSRSHTQMQPCDSSIKQFNGLKICLSCIWAPCVNTLYWLVPYDGNCTVLLDWRKELIRISTLCDKQFDKWI